MTLPGWVEPDPPGDGGDDHGSEGPHDAPGTTAPEAVDPTEDAEPGSAELDTKPVLEWTNDDWSRWIDNNDSALPRTPAGVDTDPPSTDRPDAAGPEPAGPSDELSAGEAPGADRPVAGGEDVETPDVDADGEPAGGGADTLREPLRGDADAGSDPGGASGSEAADDHPVEPDPFDTDTGTGLAWPGDPDPGTGVGPGAEPAEPAAWLSDPLDEPTEVVAVVPGRHEEPAADDEWAGVADHPWWESAPVLDEVNEFAGGTEPEPEPVTESTWGPEPTPEPVSAPWVDPPERAPLAPPPDVFSSNRPRPAPGAPMGTSTAGAWAAAPTRIVDPSHRVRSAFGLLGVAILVGTVTAGLITVAIFAVALALRHAVG